VFENPQDGGIKAFEMTYDFRCAAGQQRRHDIIFTQADGTPQPSALAPASWSAVSPGTPTATVREIACGGALPSGATSIAGIPFASAARFFPAPAMASAAPVRGAGSGGLLSRDALVACLRQTSGPVSAACRDARASAARGRAARLGNSQSPVRSDAATAGESYAQLLDRIVQTDSQDWAVNSYASGSMQIVDVRRDARGNITMLRGNYRYGRGNPRYAGTIFGGASITTGSETAPWVEAYFANGRLQCLQYHDRSSCITSTRDYYEEARQAESEHAEYCAITRNC
jgi:hypothetical protein